MPVTTSEKAKQKNKNAQVESLLLKLASGNAGVMEQLYDEIKTDVYAFALAKIGNCADADDIVQDTFVQIFKNSTKYTPQGKPMAWIITIELNLIRRFMSVKKRTCSMGEGIDFVADTVVFEQRTIDSVFLQKLLEKLNEEEREVISLHVVTGLKHREIAKLLNKPLSTILSKYNRAIKKLQDIAREDV